MNQSAFAPLELQNIERVQVEALLAWPELIDPQLSLLSLLLLGESILILTLITLTAN